MCTNKFILSYVSLVNVKVMVKVVECTATAQCSGEWSDKGQCSNIDGVICRL